MPMNINPDIGMDDGANETTRRVAFQPSFEPLTSFEPPSLKETLHQETRTPKVSLHVGHEEPKGTWKLKSVPVLSTFHPLEKTAVFVPHSNPTEVSMRVSEVLRERSIDATFNNEKAKAVCLTSDGVDFRVRLYSGRGEFSHGIIVEVQRRFGTSTTFYEETRAILDAAEGKVPPPPPPLSTGSIPLAGVDDTTPSPVQPSDSLVMISELLNHSGHDSTFLALQMLVSLTDASKMGAATAEAVSNELLRLDDSNEVAGNIFSLLMDKSGDSDVYKLRSLTFHAVANALRSVQGKVSSLLEEQLCMFIVDALQDAEKSPRVAYQAARMAEYFNKNELRSPLETALAVGQKRHAALERQAQMCLRNLA